MANKLLAFLALLGSLASPPKAYSQEIIQPNLAGGSASVSNPSSESQSATISTAVTGEGVIFTTPSSGPYPFGSTVTFTAVAAPGWEFLGWSGDLASSL
ncbi:MAG: InlB B-repeat-containing protein, partial [Verrucomicrobiales bacterium]